MSQTAICSKCRHPITLKGHFTIPSDYVCRKCKLDAKHQAKIAASITAPCTECQTPVVCNDINVRWYKRLVAVKLGKVCCGEACIKARAKRLKATWWSVDKNRKKFVRRMREANPMFNENTARKSARTKRKKFLQRTQNAS